MKKGALLLKYASIVILILTTGNASAQLKGDHLLGDAGLQSGTMSPPSFTIVVPFYNYHTSNFKDKDGHSPSSSPDVNMFVTGIGASIVSPKKIFNASWGVTLLLPFAANKIEGGLVSSKSSLAFSDIYFEPVQLGWKTTQADFTVGYALYIPTGKYSPGASDNSGLGTFSSEFSAGTTLYFDKKKEWNFSALFSYAFNSAKKNTGDNDITVGNVLSIEGGIGKTWYKPLEGSPLPMIISAGLVYYMQFKTTEDKIKIATINNYTFNLSKDHIYALGVEGNVFFPRIRSSIILRWLGEFGASNRFQGNTLFITLAPYIKFLAPKK